LQWLVVCWLLAGAAAAPGASIESYAGKISSLVDPAKLQTLGERGANPRVQKYVALLSEAKAEGLKPEKVAKQAVSAVGMKGEAAKLTIKAMVENLGIAEKSGCTDAEGLHDMRRGQAPTVRKGDHRGDQLSVDHVIPRSVVPELDKVIANLELVPLKGNEEKSDKVGKRQIELGRKLRKAGLLSKAGLRALEERGS